jgi:glutamine amidotransferase
MTQRKSVTVIDYGMGNIWSVKAAFEYLNCDVQVTGDPRLIIDSERLVLPGVGSFKLAMESILGLGIKDAVLEYVNEKKRNILGICLGMQLLGLASPEEEETNGLGLVNGRSDRFDVEFNSELKLPHVGFDAVKSSEGTKLFQGMAKENDFYFVHEYRMKSVKGDVVVATCDYGGEFVAAYEVDNVFGTQFHPEKSQSNGLLMLNNFVNL